MVTPTKDPRSLQRQDIGSDLHDAELASRTCLVEAQRALLRLGKEYTETAGSQTLTGSGNSRNQLLGLRIGRAHHPESDPLGAPWTDSRKPTELAD
jgi:hypothetical protein